MEGENVRDDREGSDAPKTKTDYNAEEETDRDEVSITEKIAIAAEQNVDGLASTDDQKHDTEVADQMAQHFDDNNETVLVDANGMDNAESTESYEFANGSDETSSWESFSGKQLLSWFFKIC